MWLFAQDDGGGSLLSFGVSLGVALAMTVLIIAGFWAVFAKAGKPGWAIIVPIYNFIVLLEIVGRPVWWVILLLLPCVHIFFMLIVSLDLAKSFGKGAGFGIGLWLLGPIFIPILGFGSAQYVGPTAAQN